MDALGPVVLLGLRDRLRQRLARPGNAIVQSRRRSYGGRDWEAKDSHLHDLESRLGQAGIKATHLATGFLGDKTVLAKARRKILDQGLAGRDLTPAMLDTPRERLRTRALRGHWTAFPVSPRADCDLFEGVSEEARFERRGSFGIAMDLGEVAKELDAVRVDQPAQRLALWRADVTASMEAFEEGLRDSDGGVATFTGEALARYAGLPWEEITFAAADYYQDLCNVCVWDNWGLLYQRRLGCDWWMPVTAMAETAMAAGRTQLTTSQPDSRRHRSF